MALPFSIQSTDKTPVTEPVLIEDVKQWAVIDHSLDDALIQRIIKGSRIAIENYIHGKLVEADVVAKYVASDYLALPLGVAKDGTVTVQKDGTTVAATEYKNYGSYLLFDYKGDYQVSYTTGHIVDEGLKQAVLMLCAYRYKNRGDGEAKLQQGIPEDIKALLHPYTMIWL